MLPRHLPGTLNLPFNSSFVTWAGWLLRYDEPFYLIADPEHVEAVQRDLLAIGLDQAEGYFAPTVLDEWLAGGRALQDYRTATPEQLAEAVLAGEVTLLDVRARSEWDEGHLPNATHTMLGFLPRRISEIPADKPIVVQCRSGARSAIAASVLQASGLTNVINLSGGLQAWQRADLPTVSA